MFDRFNCHRFHSLKLSNLYLTWSGLFRVSEVGEKSGNRFGEGEVRKNQGIGPFPWKMSSFVHFHSLVQKFGAMFNTLKILSLKYKLLFHYI